MIGRDTSRTASVGRRVPCISSFQE